VLVTLVSQYINTPFLLAGCITYLVSHAAGCTCPTCKPQFGIGPRGFAQRWCFVLPILCFAPYHLPEQLWRIAFPPPCEHNRCRLIRDMLQPQPWYHPLRYFHKPLQSQPPPPHKLSLFSNCHSNCATRSIRTQATLIRRALFKSHHSGEPERVSTTPTAIQRRQRT
jgi:hypothetical protein